MGLQRVTARRWLVRAEPGTAHKQLPCLGQDSVKKKPGREPGLGTKKSPAEAGLWSISTRSGGLMVRRLRHEIALTEELNPRQECVVTLDGHDRDKHRNEYRWQ